MASHDELVAQFTEIAGGDDNIARFYLESSNWALDEAITNFLGNLPDSEMEESLPAALGNVSSEAAIATDEHPPAAAQASPANKFDDFRSKAPKSKVATLHDMAQRSSDDEEEGQAFYAGGSERSGQQVLGPPKRKNFREQLTDMFRMAQEQGIGVEVPSSSASPTSSGVTWGQGVRLGQTASDHAVVNPASKEKDAQKKPAVILKLWSQGFSINDGELRLYNDPENKEFLETVMRGEIPNELLEMGWMVNVDVEDHRHEDYKKKLKPVKTFKGSGHALGSPVPNIIEEPIILPNVSDASTSRDPAEDEKLASKNLNVNTSESVTSLQIRLDDGSRLAAQFNMSHTVGDIRQYIQTARPQYANRNFILVSSFPTRELTDDAATIDSAGLKNAAIMQRLK